uniref:Uncharacterized protein MANES_05G039500 n=1 Tax=Rhizophora mucronata TaxID=61149 RepID=A0A2P2JYF4_RHIMU
MGIIKISKIIVPHSYAFFDQIGPVRIEFTLQLILPLVGSAVDHLAPVTVHSVVGTEPPVNLLHDFSKELRVLALLDLVVGHPQRLHLHRRVVTVVGNEKEPRDLGPPRVETGVRFDI